MSRIEVDVLLKAQEHRLKTVMEQIETKHEERLKRQADTFQHEVKELQAVAKEHHIMFVEAVNKVKEDVNLKFEEIHTEMSKEIVKLDQNYSNLHSKVDIIVDAVL